MIYKKYEFSLSLNGSEIYHIARNAAGTVVFRARSEKELKNMIDQAIYDEEQRRAQEAKKKSETATKKKKVASEPEAEEEVVEEVVETKEDKPVATSPVTRGPDGKFISKSQLESEEPKKKGFWEKLAS